MTTRQRSVAQASMESDRIAAIYETRLWRRNPFVSLLQGLRFEAEYALVEKALHLRENARLLDLACGPGIYTRPLASLVPRGRVVGADLSAPMLKRARRTARSEGLRDLLFMQADAQALPLRSQHFDAVCCCGALHLFPDTVAALAEIARVLKPGGRLAISAFRRRRGTLAEKLTAMRRHRTGMDAFLPEALAKQLEEQAFCDVRCLHERGIWLVMSATRAQDG